MFIALSCQCQCQCQWPLHFNNYIDLCVRAISTRLDERVFYLSWRALLVYRRIRQSFRECGSYSPIAVLVSPGAGECYGWSLGIKLDFLAQGKQQGRQRAQKPSWSSLRWQRSRRWPDARGEVGQLRERNDGRNLNWPEGILACLAYLPEGTANLLPRAIRGLGPTNDPGAGWTIARCDWHNLFSKTLFVIGLFRCVVAATYREI